MTTWATWQSRPLFVTSTFRDMHAERSHLWDVVFPALEERLRERFHHLDPVDLRLGVATAEAGDPAARELLILKVCLSEIERSRPFLIGLVGDRYGWVPPPERMDAAAREADFGRDLTGRSVTALEIEYGILGNRGQKSRSRFYLRDPLPYDQMSPGTAAEYSEAHAGDPQAGQRAQRLRALRTFLERELPPERVRRYRAGWDPAAGRVVGLEAWGRQVIEDLWEDLDAETRASLSGAARTWQEQEARLVEQFVATSCVEFVGREEAMNDLEDLATGTGAVERARGVCLVGPPGSGKSSVFAELHRRLRGRNLVLLAHAAGISPRSSDVDGILRRWCFELSRSIDVPDPSEGIVGGDALRDAFATLLARTAAERRVVCLIDSLDQLERSPAGRHSTWLPLGWPANARLIATAIPGTESQGLLSPRPWLVPLDLAPLDRTEAEAIAARVAARRRSPVGAELLQALMSKLTPSGTPASGNPLWLELALEEVLLLDEDDFRRAEKQYAGEPMDRLHLLRLDVARALPATVEELYGCLLEHAQMVHGSLQAREFVSLLAVSRSGWRESDLRALLPVRAGEPFDELRFATLRRGYRAHLVQRGTQGQWDFSHGQMREAIRRRHLGHENSESPLHAAIADHLETLAGGDPVRRSELMWHLLHSGEPARAAKYYAGPLAADELAWATRAFASWILEQSEKNRLEEGVESMLSAEGVSDDVRGRLCRRCIFDLAGVLGHAASLAIRLTVQSAVRSTLKRLVTTDPGNASWQWDLSRSHNELGDILAAQGDRNAALEAYREALEITKRLDLTLPGIVVLLASHVRAGDVLTAQGDREAAMAAYRKVLEVAERLVLTDPGNDVWRLELSIGHSRLGDVLAAQGDRNAALAAHRKALEIVERLALTDPGNPDWQRELAASHIKLGDDLAAQGDRMAPLAGYGKALDILERLVLADPGNPALRRDLAASHSKLGDVLAAQGDRNTAFEAYRRSLEILERLAFADPGNTDWQRDLSTSHNKFGDVLAAHGDHDAALAAYRRSLEIRERLALTDPGSADRRRDLSVSHIKLGDALAAKRDHIASLAAYRRALEITECLLFTDSSKAGWQRDLSISHERVGTALAAQGDLSAALVRQRRALEIRERLALTDPGNADWQQDLSISHEKVGDVLAAQGNRNAALEAFRKALEIRERLALTDPGNTTWQRDLSINHDKLGGFLAAQGDHHAALEAYRKSLEIDERLALADAGSANRQRDLAVSLERVGEALAAQGDTSAALGVHRRCLEIRERLSLADPGNTVWQRDLAVSHNNLGDVLAAQRDLGAAMSAYGKALEIAERLTLVDPGNASWQRDLAVLHYKLAWWHRQEKNLSDWLVHLHRCAATLHRMQRLNMTLDASLTGLLAKLNDAGIRPDSE